MIEIKADGFEIKISNKKAISEVVNLLHELSRVQRGEVYKRKLRNKI